MKEFDELKIQNNKHLQMLVNLLMLESLTYMGI